MVLTDEQRQYYECEGYIVLDTGIENAILDAVVADLRDKYTSETKDKDLAYQDAGRIQDAWRINPNVKSLALNPRILGALEELYERKPLAFQTLNFPVGTEQAPHSDTIHFNSMPSGFMCGVWFALEDMDENNGTLMFYPGSHKLPEVKRQNIKQDLKIPMQSASTRFLLRGLRKLKLAAPQSLAIDDASEIYPLYEKYIAELIEKKNLQPTFANIRKGQALIWAANLLHGGSPHKDKNRTRHSQVTHYFFENCRYYTPLLSNDSFTQWRNPTWIS